MEWKYVGEAGIELKARNSHSMGIVSTQSPFVPTSAPVPVPALELELAPVPVPPSSSHNIQSAADTQATLHRHSTATTTPHTHTCDTNSSHIVKTGDLLKKSYLVIYAGASPEEGPMGDTVYAALPDPDDIGK